MQKLIPKRFSRPPLQGKHYACAIPLCPAVPAMQKCCCSAPCNGDRVLLRRLYGTLHHFMGYGTGKQDHQIRRADLLFDRTGFFRKHLRSAAVLHADICILTLMHSFPPIITTLISFTSHGSRTKRIFRCPRYFWQPSIPSSSRTAHFTARQSCSAQLGIFAFSRVSID